MHAITSLARALGLCATTVTVAILVGCNNDVHVVVRESQQRSAVRAETATPIAPTADPRAARTLGAPIVSNLAPVALATIAAHPSDYAGKDLVTEGTVTAVCQHRGCWMNLKQDAGEAFIRIAGHAFAIPRDAVGKHVRLQGRLRATDAPEPTCSSGEKHAGGGCKAEAEGSLGHPLAKLELDATGVEVQ
jgi:hypothetical protein